MKRAAIVYDFDKTLCTKDMQEYSLIPSLGYDSPGVFWDEVTELCIRYRMDSISAYLYYLQKKFNEAGTPLKKDMFRQPGLEIELFPGVKTWFRRINDYGRKAGFLVEHYIISSGMAEIIENSEIADEFRKIYACRYYYENGEAVWPAQVVNYTTKTQYIFRINKQVLDESDDSSLNEYVAPAERPQGASCVNTRMQRVGIAAVSLKLGKAAALQIGGIPTEQIKKELPFIGVVVKKDEDLEIVRHGGLN